MDKNSKQDLRICPYAAAKQSAQSPEEDISLFAIWYLLCSQRMFIGAITGAFFCIALAFAFFSPESYTAKVEITPADKLNAQLAVLLGVNDSIKLPSAEEAFSVACTNLTANEIQSQFWTEIVSGGNLIQEKSAKTGEGTEKWFAQNLQLQLSKGRNAKHGQTFVLLTGSDSANTTELLKQFINFVDGYSGKEIVKDLKIQLDEKKAIIKNNIEIQQAANKQKRMDKIDELNVAIKIAENLGLNDLPNNLVDTPLYARGAKALQLERDGLLKSTNDDAFDSALVILKKQLENLNKINADEMKVATLQTGKILLPDKNKKNLLFFIAFGIFVGLILGIFMAFLRNLLQTTPK